MKKYKNIFKQKQYMKLVIANVINRFGDAIDCIALTWLVYQVTHDASWSAIIFGVNRLPTVFIQPFAGVLVEKSNKKRVMVITDLLRAICVGFLATRLLLGVVTSYDILIITFMISTIEAFRLPCSMSFTIEVLNPDDYDHGIALNNSLTGVVDIIGTALAGVIIALCGVVVSIYIDMLTFILSAGIEFTIHPQYHTLQEKKENYFQSLRSGLSLLKNHHILKHCVIIAVILNALLVPFNSLQVVYVQNILHGTSFLLSVLGITMSIGMIAGSSFYPMIKEKLGGFAIISIGCLSVTIFYVGLYLIGFINNSGMFSIILAIVIMLYFGFWIACMNSYVSVFMMSSIDKSYLSRVSAIVNAFCQGAIPIMSFVVSFLVQYILPSQLFLLCGISNCIVCILFIKRENFE